MIWYIIRQAAAQQARKARSNVRPFQQPVYPKTCRHFGSDYYKLRKKKEKPDPWTVLGITDEDAYILAKKKFLRIAMDHHPDTSKATTKETQEKHREIFVAARTAFEQLAEGPQGQAMLREDSGKAWDDDKEMDAWFRDETGFDMPFMDAQTMREVAKMTQAMGGDSAGLDRDGGMWTLARMVTESVKQGGDGGSILALEAGTVRDRQIDGELRRRRRR